MTGPQRRVTDHFHPEYWTEADHHRFEDRVSKELQQMRAEIRELARNVLLMLGALALLGFPIPIFAPFLRSALGNP